MAFTVRGSLNPHGAPVLKRAIITNSVVSTLLDSVKITSGFAALGTAGALVFGHVNAHTTRGGVGLNTSGATGAAIGSYTNTYTAASNNQTVAQAVVECDISKYTLYAGTPDATIGTTTGSNLLGYHTDLIDQNDIDEDNATTATAQYTIWGVDQENTAQGVYSIYESQVFGL